MAGKKVSKKSSKKKAKKKVYKKPEVKDVPKEEGKAAFSGEDSPQGGIAPFSPFDKRGKE